jgi:four helix bundle protein
MSYSIENLDVYRKSIITCANLCRFAAETAGRGHAALAEQLQQRALCLVTNLADGLGFWEKELKAGHFSACKRAVLETLPLLEVTAGLGLMDTDAGSRLAEEVRDLAKMINGLLRGARRREEANEKETTAPATVQEGPPTRH